jgi:hypothetical protein
MSALCWPWWLVLLGITFRNFFRQVMRSQSLYGSRLSSGIAISRLWRNRILCVSLLTPLKENYADWVVECFIFGVDNLIIPEESAMKSVTNEDVRKITCTECDLKLHSTIDDFRCTVSSRLLQRLRSYIEWWLVMCDKKGDEGKGTFELCQVRCCSQRHESN